MVPFLAEDLFSLLRGIMQRFIKGSLLEGISKKELVNLDPADSEKAMNYKKIDIGFAAEKELSALAKAKKISSLQIMDFRKAVHALLEALATKLL